MRGDFVILSGHADLAAARSRAAAAAGKMREQIPQVEVLEGELPAAELFFPVRRRAEVLPGSIAAAQTVVGGAFLRILERLVGFADFLEFLLGPGLLGNVRMVLSRELPVRLLDLLGARLALDAHHRVVVFVFHPKSGKTAESSHREP